ncbi:MAG: hypothetical protein FH753_10120 [Firmicutes bacterium]|nr:hypothetical protein [Bacillota bacterium]
MALIDLIYENYKKISIVGMAKNSGKTVTLNQIIEEAFNEDIIIGITSTGRDGERQDVVTNTEKPTIYVTEGVLIATTTENLSMGDAKVEVISVTDYRTPLGNIVIGRVKDDGYVQIAGPQTNKGIKEVSDLMLELGAELVIVDGSLNRISSASPLVTEATILATGAVVSRNMNKVIKETIHTTNLFSLEEVNKAHKSLIEDIMDNKKVAIVNKDLTVKYLDIKTAINSGSIIASNIDDDTEYVVFPGALVKKTVEDIIKSNKRYKDIKLIAMDGTKIFIKSKDWLKFRRYGLEVNVLYSIKTVAVTINPYSPTGYYFNPKEFLEKTRSFLKDVDVFDVMLGGE